MPTFIYKAVTKTGQVVKNKIEESNKQSALRLLKRNDLMPISVTQIKYKSKNKKGKKNVDNIEEILKDVDTNNLTYKKKVGRREKIEAILNKGAKITDRDLIIFTQDLYLLKKANFNNIHALATIIETTENIELKAIIEDILMGVEARWNHVFNDGVLCRYISIYIHKHCKSRRNVGVFNRVFIAGCKIFG